ncbi:hypothetical protein PHMEG_00027651 [Phytophthora megakarya]|uniref:Uncharacterized protein n=1 Tax=Phytophthora megakarya TaxID=4795 RepID=A0A225V811_9STRA|nr:hypothetical protein PHMEG_00027651 [Phytophthora megakarya]
MTADDPNPFGDSDSASDEPSVPSQVTETHSNSTATTICAADPPVAGPLVSTPLSEERLWELLNSSSQYTLENACQAMDGRLAEMLRFYATLHWGVVAQISSVDWMTHAAAQASLKSAEASRTVMEILGAREASLNVQISEMNAVIKSHQEMYDRLENWMQLALCSNEILTKEVNHGRSEYLLRERNRYLVRRVKRLEKANSSLSSRLRLEDMDPEALVLMVEDSQTRRALKALYKIGLEDGRDHDTLADDIARAKVRFAEIRADFSGFQCFHALKSGSEHSAAGGGNSYAAAVPSAPPSTEPAGSSQSPPVPPAHSPPASTPPAPPVSGGKQVKGKAKRRCTGPDDEDVDFGGGDSGEDAPEEGQKSRPSSKSSSQSSWSKPYSSKPSVPAPAQHKAGSAPKKVDVAVSDAESMSSPRVTPMRKAAMSSEFQSSFRLTEGSRSDIKSLTSESSPGQSAQSPSKSKKSHSQKTGAKARSGHSVSDEHVISVSSESESESSSDQDSSASEGSEAHEDEESELSKLRPESKCLEDLPNDTLDAPRQVRPPQILMQWILLRSPNPKPSLLQVPRLTPRPHVVVVRRS